LVKTFRPDYRAKPHRQLSKLLAKCFPVNRLAQPDQWFRSARLVVELSDLMKRRHPSVQAEIDRVYKEHLGERRNPKGAPVVRRE
jgi:hypothetical protein